METKQPGQMTREQLSQTLSEKLLKDVPLDRFSEWLEKQRATARNHRVVEGFRVMEIGPTDGNTEMALIELVIEGRYRQHRHVNSDAMVVVIAGRGYLLTGKEKRLLVAGDRVEIPRGTPHGFELLAGDRLEFLSVQSPPIRNPDTKKDDFEFVTEEV